ncbi:TetR/AcrR family transcriptional regulator [Krasilnikoviella flava]|uniref:Transcriptional regulator, TetR family n=1 Tax=Krasilnikoviella flava TaxID=526729 RepID=A0A1T5I760_9MICO|nr:TetR/AcrR family transcriptional regulator [Krasilnikoviella flava]SKC35015.1 transcriptional regulator, TetR family [Krasilnikoviella flava]
MPVPQGSTLDPDRTRSACLDVATELFYARGVDAVGVAEVCSTAGISKQTLYRHFGSKDGLVEAMVERRSERVWRWLEDAATAAGPAPQARLTAVFDALGGWFSEAEFRGCGVMNAVTQHRSAGLLRLAARHLDRYRGLLAAIAVDAGAADAAGTAEQLLQVLEGATLLASTSPHPADAARTGRDAALALLAASRT